MVKTSKMLGISLILLYILLISVIVVHANPLWDKYTDSSDNESNDEEASSENTDDADGTDNQTEPTPETEPETQPNTEPYTELNTTSDTQPGTEPQIHPRYEEPATTGSTNMPETYPDYEEPATRPSDVPDNQNYQPDTGYKDDYNNSDEYDERPTENRVGYDTRINYTPPVDDYQYYDDKNNYTGEDSYINNNKGEYGSGPNNNVNNNQGEYGSGPNNNVNNNKEGYGPGPNDDRYFGEIKVPEGCIKKKTSTGIYQIECDIEKDKFSDFNIKDKVEKCDGKFEIIDGAPTCIQLAEKSFMGGIICPSDEDLERAKKGCSGKIKEFRDMEGCLVVMCIHEEFKKEYDERISELYGDDPLKKESILCQKNGGKLTIVNNMQKCIQRREETIQVRKDLRKINEDDVNKAKEKMGKLKESLDAITDKLEPVKEMYEKKGDKKGAEVIEAGIEKLDDAMEKLIDIKLTLSSDLSEEKRRELLVELGNVQQRIADVTKAIIEGEMPTEEKRSEETFEEYEEFYGNSFENEEEFKKQMEQEKQSIDIIRKCSITSFSPPDPNGIISEVKVHGIVDEERCKIEIFTDKGSAEFLLPEKVYTNFRGPDDFVRGECSGECDYVKQITRGPEGKDEKCMSECIKKDCDEDNLECFKKNREACEKECGMEMEMRRVDMNKVEECIFECVGPNIKCKPAGPEAGGEQNPECMKCAEKCTDIHGSGNKCLTEDAWEEKEKSCKTCEHCYGEPVYGKSEEGYHCIIDVRCFDSSKEWGDNPGTGPDNWEEGHGPGEEYGSDNKGYDNYGNYQQGSNDTGNHQQGPNDTRNYQQGPNGYYNNRSNQQGPDYENPSGGYDTGEGYYDDQGYDNYGDYNTVPNDSYSNGSYQQEPNEGYYDREGNYHEGYPNDNYTDDYNNYDKDGNYSEGYEDYGNYNENYYDNGNDYIDNNDNYYDDGNNYEEYNNTYDEGNNYIEYNNNYVEDDYDPEIEPKAPITGEVVKGKQEKSPRINIIDWFERLYK